MRNSGPRLGHGPLPTAVGPRPRTYQLVRSPIRAPVVGEALYCLNTLDAIIGLMYQRHVYAEPARVTTSFVSAKRAVARQHLARFASSAFVTGALDPVADQDTFLALAKPLPAPLLLIYGAATPPKSRVEMQVFARVAGVESCMIAGSLGLNEEQPVSVSVSEKMLEFLVG